MLRRGREEVVVVVGGGGGGWRVGRWVDRIRDKDNQIMKGKWLSVSYFLLISNVCVILVAAVDFIVIVIMHFVIDKRLYYPRFNIRIHKLRLEHIKLEITNNTDLYLVNFDKSNKFSYTMRYTA